MTHKTVPIEYDKTAMNAFVTDFYDNKIREGKHGHYETLYSTVHAAIKRHVELSAAPPDNTVQELREQLNEADRRAGAAERQMQSYVSECQSRKDWIRKAKEEWGVDNSVSFDVVWKEALQLRDQVAELQKQIEGLKLDLHHATRS